MKHTVRTKDGEIVFGSFGDVERAWLQGLVEPDDEILEEGQTRWRRAGSIPLLAQARRHGDQVWGGSQMAWIVIIVVLSSIALYQLTHGRYGWGLGLSFVIAVILFRITTNAYKKSKPHR